MDKNKIIAIGDIHGEYVVLGKMLELLENKYDLKSVQVVFQELTDRGLNSQLTIDMVKQFIKKYPQTVVIQSNHDMLNCEGQYYGIEYLESAALDYQNGKVSEEHREFLASFPIYLETEKFIFIHGGLSEGLAHPSQDDTNRILWNTGTYDEYDGEKRIVMGHTVRQDIIETPKLLYIDTGATFYHYRKLSAVVLDDKTGYCEEKISIENSSMFDTMLRKQVHMRRKMIYDRFF